jgi:hypothetical protein
MSPSSLRRHTFEVARNFAAQRGQPLYSTFDDTLSGDVARLQVLRKLRRMFPDAPRNVIVELIEEVLTP